MAEFKGATFEAFRKWISADKLGTLQTRYQLWRIEKLITQQPLGSGHGPDGQYDFVDWLYDVAYTRYCKRHDLERGEYDVDHDPITAEDI